MGNYRITIEAWGPHHGYDANTADGIARAAIAELERNGATINAAKLEALNADGSPTSLQLPVDLLTPVPMKGQAVLYWFTNAGGTRMSRHAIVTHVWSPSCINVDVAFEVSDTERGQGDAPLHPSRSSVLGGLAFEATQPEIARADAPAGWMHA